MSLRLKSLRLQLAGRDATYADIPPEADEPTAQKSAATNLALIQPTFVPEVAGKFQFTIFANEETLYNAEFTISLA